MSDLTDLGAADLADALARGETSSVEATRACLERIEAHDTDLRAFLHVDPDGALDAARQADERRRAGRPRR